MIGIIIIPMRKTTIVLVALLVLAAAALGIYVRGGISVEPTIFDPLNADYDLDGMQVTLVNGKSEVPIGEDMAATINTRAFREPFFGDLTGDGKNDAGLFIYQDPGGTGTFFYVAAAIDDKGKTITTKAVLLGDRIAPQSIIVINNEMIVSYMVREEGEPFTATPSVMIERRFIIENNDLKEVL